MKRALTTHRAALPLVGFINTPEEALRVSARVAAYIRSLSGRARLAQAAELQDLCHAMEERIESLERDMAQIRQDIERSRRSARVCIAYVKPRRPMR